MRFSIYKSLFCLLINHSNSKFNLKLINCLPNAASSVNYTPVEVGEVIRKKPQRESRERVLDAQTPKK